MLFALRIGTRSLRDMKVMHFKISGANFENAIELLF